MLRDKDVIPKGTFPSVKSPFQARKSYRLVSLRRASVGLQPALINLGGVIDGFAAVRRAQRLSPADLER